MRKIVRLIFRFDFDTSFGLMDRPGTIAQFLTSDEYWKEVGERQDSRTMSARRRASDKLFSHINIDPKAINGSIESADGQDWNDNILGEFMSVCSSTTDKILKEFEINRINRIGLRIFFVSYMDKIQGAEKNKFITAFFKQFSNNGGGVLSDIADCSLILEGTTPEQVGYRFHFGPGSKGDLRKFFQNVRVTDDMQEAAKPHQLAADIDLYERNVDFASLTLAKWVRTKWPIAQEMLDGVSIRMRGRKS